MFSICTLQSYQSFDLTVPKCHVILSISSTACCFFTRAVFLVFGRTGPLISFRSVKCAPVCLPSTGKTENIFLSAQTEKVSLACQSQQRYSWTQNSSRYQVSLNEDIKTRSYSHAASSECHLSLSLFPLPSLPDHFPHPFIPPSHCDGLNCSPGGDFTVRQLVAVGLASLCETV